MRSIVLAVAAAGSLILGVVAVHAIAVTVSELVDPCWQWGVPSSGTLSLPAGGPCRHTGASGETRTHAVVKLLVCPGGILLAIALAVMGEIRYRAALTWSGAALMFLESPLLWFTIWPVSVFTGTAFLLLGVYRSPARLRA
ncbi:MAG: hypothetical protein LAP87_07490 [Acidobacteriia bacterium]|nr:hypothetical protein [Terriglobia bacterium]